MAFDTAEEMLIEADLCEREAGRTASKRRKVQLLELARLWRQLADMNGRRVLH